MKNRWYDDEPTLSLAISLLRNTNEKTRTKCAAKIIELAQSRNVALRENIFERLDLTLRRWYDKNKQLTEAMEYLKSSNEFLRKEIALDVIEFLELAEIE